MTCAQIVKVIEAAAPRALAYSKDNVGFLCGDAQREVTKILLTLDLDEGVVQEAHDLGANLIIGHHPIMYRGTKTLTTDAPESRAIEKLFCYGITYYAAHTNLDIAKGGLNDLLASLLGLQDIASVEAVEVPGEGIGRIGTVDAQSALDFAKHAKTVLGAQGARFCGDENKVITRVAVNTGGGASLCESAFQMGADLFLSGDFSYPQMREYAARGMCILDIDHYAVENLRLLARRASYAAGIVHYDKRKYKRHRKFGRIHAADLRHRRYHRAYCRRMGARHTARGYQHLKIKSAMLYDKCHAFDELCDKPCGKRADENVVCEKILNIFQAFCSLFVPRHEIVRKRQKHIRTLVILNRILCILCEFFRIIAGFVHAHK